MKEANNSKFVAEKWNIVNANYDVGNEIIYNTEVLKPNLCYYNDAYILLKGYNTVTAAPATQELFEIWVPFTNCITKIDGTAKDYAKDLDLVMPLYNLIKHLFKIWSN